VTPWLILILAGLVVMVAAGAWSRRGATPLPPRTGKLLVGLLLVVFVLAVAWIMSH
jgi:hypothetical protein